MNQPKSSYKLKLLLVGPTMAGKSSILARFFGKPFQKTFPFSLNFYITTIEVEYVQGKVATLSIWDVGGMDRFEVTRKTLYKGASGCFFVFSLMDPTSFERIKSWIKEAFGEEGKLPFVLIGNKVEYYNELDGIREEAIALAEDNGAIYLETSALNGENIENAFSNLVKIVTNAEVELKHVLGHPNKELIKEKEAEEQKQKKRSMSISER